MARAAAVKAATTAAASSARRRHGPLLLPPAITSTAAIAAAAASTSRRSSSSHSRASALSTSGGGWFSALFGGSSRPKGHRPFNENEERHVRLATRKKDKVLSANPGARVEPGFVSPAEGEAAAADAFEILKRYGISHVTKEQRAFMAGQMKHVPLPKEEVRRARAVVCTVSPSFELINDDGYLLLITSTPAGGAGEHETRHGPL